jgi:hypothetical protein
MNRAVRAAVEAGEDVAPGATVAAGDDADVGALAGVWAAHAVTNASASARRAIRTATIIARLALRGR